MPVALHEAELREDAVKISKDARELLDNADSLALEARRADPHGAPARDEFLLAQFIVEIRRLCEAVERRGE